MHDKFSINNLLNSISKLISEEEVIDKRNRNSGEKAHDDEIQQAILVLAAEVIRCNRNFSEDTERFVAEFLRKQFGVRSARSYIHSINNQLDTGTQASAKMACKVLSMLTDYESRLTIVQFLFGLAAADDFINAKEIRCLHRISSGMGVSDNDFKALRDNFTSVNSPYKILGLEEGATIVQVKAAYRKMVLKFHPDKRSAQLSEEEATIKFLHIKRAFEVIIEGRQKTV
jgi:DnaJ like chaperone protein